MADGDIPPPPCPSVDSDISVREVKNETKIKETACAEYHARLAYPSALIAEYGEQDPKAPENARKDATACLLKSKVQAKTRNRNRRKRGNCVLCLVELLFF
jgi:hypothetical protein